MCVSLVSSLSLLPLSFLMSLLFVIVVRIVLAATLVIVGIVRYRRYCSLEPLLSVVSSLVVIAISIRISRIFRYCCCFVILGIAVIAITVAVVIVVTVVVVVSIAIVCDCSCCPYCAVGSLREFRESPSTSLWTSSTFPFSTSSKHSSMPRSSFLGPFGAVFGPPRGHIGPSSGHLGAIWGLPGGYLGAILGPSWAIWATR